MLAKPITDVVFSGRKGFREAARLRAGSRKGALQVATGFGRAEASIQCSF